MGTKQIKNKIRKTIEFCEDIGIKIDYAYIWGDESSAGIVRRLNDTLEAYKNTGTEYLLTHMNRERVLARLIASIELEMNSAEVHPYFTMENILKMAGIKYV